MHYDILYFVAFKLSRIQFWNENENFHNKQNAYIIIWVDAHAQDDALSTLLLLCLNTGAKSLSAD